MTATIDGRSARRHRNRAEVVEAAVALFESGVAEPSIEQLSERSGVSARSIFRYFDGLDDLRRAVIRRCFEDARSLLEPADAGDGSLDDRIRRFVDSRLKFNEAVAGPARTALSRSPSVPLIAQDLSEYRRVMEGSIREHFSSELKTRSRTEADDLVAVIAALVSFPSWDLLTRDQGRSRTQVKRAWALALERLLA